MSNARFVTTNRKWLWVPGDKAPSPTSWKVHAVERWGKEAKWIFGQGKYAVLSRCGPLTITLWYFKGQAQQRFKALNRNTCGPKCVQRHELVSLPPRRP